MSQQPLTYQRIEDAMRSLLNHERGVVADYVKAGDELAETEVEYKRAWAEARVIARHDYREQTIKYTQDMVEDAAQLATHEQFTEYMKAKNRRENTRQVLGSIRAQLDCMRSLLSSHRQMNDATA